MNNTYMMITGAGGGLGKAFVNECASRGWDLFLTDKDQNLLSDLMRTVVNVYGVKIAVKECDLTNTESRNIFFDYLRENNYRFNGLINVAGLDHEGAFEARSIDEIREILTVNIVSTVEMTHSILSLRDNKEKYLQVNVCSLAGFYPMPLKAIYAASKRFLLDFTLALREELSEAGAGVTALCPAGLPTQIDVIRSIESQGIIGRITTLNVGDVAYNTISSALRNKAVVIPGAVNQLLRTMGQVIPKSIVIKTVARRWKRTRSVKERMITAAGN